MASAQDLVEWFHGGAPAADPAAPRLILVSPHFPPGEAAGALRWQKLAHVASARGWQIDVLMIEPEELHARDDSRLADLPPGVRAVGVAQQTPRLERLEQGVVAWRDRLRARAPLAPAGGAGPGGALAAAAPASLTHEEMRFRPLSLRAWLRGLNVQIDHTRQLAWSRAALAIGERLFDPSLHRAVISCGPPHVMAHETARLLALRTGLPLILDYRDPWSLVHRLPADIASPLWHRLARRFETRCVEQASLVVMNTDPAARAMAERFPTQRGKFIAVTNGYDDEPLPPSALDHTFRLAYAGTLYLDRSPELLMRACARVVRESNLTPNDFALELMGHVERLGGQSVEEMAREAGLDGYVSLHPRGTRAEAARFLARASMLVSLPQDADLCIPSKIFEYMRYDAWLLVLAIAQSATAEILEGTSADVVAPDDEAGLTRFVRERCSQFREGVRPKAIANDEIYSRRAQGHRFFDALESRIGAVTRSSP